jgi:hypothetical protein
MIIDYLIAVWIGFSFAYLFYIFIHFLPGLKTFFFGENTDE